MKFKNRLLFNIGFPIAFVMMIPIMLIWFPLIAIGSSIWWVFTGKKFEWLCEQPMEWCFQFPFKISNYWDYH